MSTLTDLTIAEARARLAAGEITSIELTEAHIAAMEAARPLNPFVTETVDEAVRMAGVSDKRRAHLRGEFEAGTQGMDGIPVAVKDLFCTAGIQTTASSRILEGFVPPYESTVTDKLWRSGAVLLGKTSCDEFAMGSSNTTSYFGAVINPWRRLGDDTDLAPGGSSGGSACAVAARCAMGALGTDTGGSIRQPAALSGVVGVKPTYGRCSRWGIVAFASSLDQAGPLTRSVRDAAIMLNAICGFDPKDSTSAQREVPNFEAALDRSVIGLKAGIPAEYRVGGMGAEIEALWRQGIAWLRDAGAEIVDISLPHTKYALPAYYIIAPAEASSNLARYDGVRYGLRVDGDSLDDLYANTRGAGFGGEVKRRILIGTYVLSAGYYDAYYKKAQRVRALIARDFELAFEKVDVILTPSTPGGAFGVGEKQDDPIAMYLNDVFTVTGNLAGLPGISVPAGLDGAGLPLGLQLLARRFDEETMLLAARVLEDAAKFTAKPAEAIG